MKRMAEYADILQIGARNSCHWSGLLN